MPPLNVSNAKETGGGAKATRSNALGTPGKPAAVKKRIAQPSEISKLQEQADAFTRKTEMEKRRIAELDRLIKDAREQIAEQRRKSGGVDAARDANLKVQRSIKILENRLDKALAKYNEALAHNKQLRLTIDNLRKERLVFDDIYKKLEAELEEKKKEMGDIIEVSNKAFEARDRAVNEMARLKTQANKEQAAFESEFGELGKQIEHDKRMKEFMKNRRDDSDAEAAAIAARGAEEEAKMKKKVIRGTWGGAKEKITSGVVQDRVQSYGDAFASIAEATGVTDVDRLVDVFVEAEDENFRLFSYVNQLNREIESLEEQIADAEKEIESHKAEGSADDAKRRKTLEALEAKLRRAETKAEAYDQKYADATETVATLKENIWNIFLKLGCNTPANRELLGEDGVTDENMMPYLGVIEQRTNEILQMFAASKAASKGTSLADSSYKTLLAQGPQTAPSATQIRIEPPSTEGAPADDDDGEEEDAGDRPLDREELRAKALRQIARREATAAQKGGAKKATPAKEPSGGKPPRAGVRVK